MKRRKYSKKRRKSYRKKGKPSLKKRIGIRM